MCTRTLRVRTQTCPDVRTTSSDTGVASANVRSGDDQDPFLMDANIVEKIKKLLRDESLSVFFG